MIKNLYFFTGDEEYLLDQELYRRVSNFTQKFGNDSVSFFHVENWDEGKAKQSIYGGGLFSTKTLTVIDGLPTGTDRFGFTVSQVENFIDEFLQKKGEIPAENLLVFANSKPDKRSRLYKFLKDNANIKEFKTMDNAGLKIYIKQELGNLKISDSVLQKFIQKVGVELYRINSEIDKLKYYCEYNSLSEITENLVDEVVFGFVDSQVFELLDYLLKDKTKAIKFLQKMQNQGLNRNAISGVLYWSLRLYIAVYHFAKNGITDLKAIATQSGINSYSLHQNVKNIPLIQKNGTKLENMYKKLIELDFDIKNGKAEEESFWLETKKLINSFKL
ncbi:MAG TPA: DNA polymerase III subunit delta [Candidatus Absconditabacterales bacterium]|nr:DNA polymerase III subunit delta [Candidatus Absconditabacterales bacterium]